MPIPSRILVCGGRDYTNRLRLFEIMNSSREYFDDEFVIISGGAPGADTLALEWASTYGIPTIEMEANWGFYSKAAGGIRNEWMLKWAQPDLVIAFPGGPGTRNMIHAAMDKGIPIYNAS